MRWSLLLFIMSIFQVHAISGFAQKTELSLNYENTSVAKILSEIEAQSRFYFLCNKELVDLDRKTNIHVENQSIDKILTEIFKGTDVQYVIMGRQIVLSPRGNGWNDFSHAMQPKSISGKVTDSSGAPLAGVTVVVKGSTHGTVTDNDGNYSLPSVSGDAALVFSFVGMRSKEVLVAGKTAINVVLEEETVGIEEVVAIGYGTMLKSDITGSISSVPMEHLKNQPIRDITDILAGRVAGMTLTRTSGQPSAETKIRVRGANSINGSNAPLMVVDGVIGGSAGSVHDIEAMEILKDASATAVYGERASNGVILITTKKATSGTPKVRVSLNTGISYQNTDYPDMMNAVEYAGFINDLQGRQTFSAAEIEDFRKTGGTDWPAAVMRAGLKNDHNISYSQKLNKIGIYLSGRYTDEKATMINTSVGGNYQLRSKVSFDPNKRLSFVLDITGYKYQSENGHLSTTDQKAHPLIQALLWSPTEPIWLNEADGVYNTQDHYGALLYNPYMNAAEAQRRSMGHGSSANLNANYKITDWLTYNVTGFASQGASQSAAYDNAWITPGDPNARRDGSQSSGWRLINRLDFNKTFNEVHNVTVTGVYETEAGEGWSVWGAGSSMPLPDLAGYYAIHISDVQRAGSGFDKSSRLAYLGRLNYNYRSKYYFTASYRVDGQSGPTDRIERNKFGGFPSFAVSWRASEESFMKDGFFDNLKFRFGWGFTGNPSGFPYARMSQVPNYSWGTPTMALGYVPGIPANPNIKWEKTAQTDIGLDATIINGKLSLTLDYFNKKTTDLLTGQQLPGYYGYGGGANYTQNLGEINNKGYEATIDFTPVKTADFYWGLNFNISTVKNKVVNLGEQGAYLTGTAGNGFIEVQSYRVQEGLPLATMWGYKFLGIWGSDEAAEAAKYGEQPGDAKYEDVNKDGTIDLANDGQRIGDANPDFTWGLSSTVSWKNFDFSLLLQGMHGQDVFNLVRGAMSSVVSDSRSILLKDPATNYWTPENQNTEWPDIHSVSSKRRMNSSQWIEDGSWVKVKYIGLTYHLPKGFSNFGDLSFSLSGTDILTFTKYKGYDPEVSASGNSDLWAGCDFGTFPIPRTVTFGVTLDF